MIDRPDTPHADVLLDGIWEEEVTPDDLASRALSAAQASSYAFRVASEGTTATAQLGEVDVADFLESETGRWAQSFIGIVRVGESLVHVSHALGELARSLQQVNLEQSEIVYQVEAEIEAAQRQSAQAGVDPAGRIAELIARARARAAEVAEKMATPETSSTTKKPAVGLVSGFMAFGRVPGASAEAAERNGRVARYGHARNGYAVRTTRTDRNGQAADERVAPVEEGAAAAAEEAFAGSAFPVDGASASAADEFVAADDPTVVAPLPETAEDPAAENVAAEPPEGDAPVITNGFLGLGRAPSPTVAADDVPVPVVPQPMINGFLSLGRAPGADVPATQGPSSGPIPVAAPTQFLPLPTTSAEAVAGEFGEGARVELGAPATPSEPGGGPSPESEPGARADAMDEGFLAFGRVPSGGGWGGSGVPPTVPVGPRAEITDDAEEPVVDITEADADEDDDVAEVGDAAVDEDGLGEPADDAAAPADTADDAAAPADTADDAAAPVDAPVESTESIDAEADEPGADEPTADETVDQVPADRGEPTLAPSRPVRKSGPVKFSDLLKAANAQKVDPAHLAPAALVAPDIAAAAQTAEPVKPAPVRATGPAILGRTEPLVLRKKASPAVEQVYDAVASILGSLRGSPHGPDSGLHWAAGLLVNDAETVMAVTTSDAGWLPPGVVIPAGVRVLWNVPAGYRWASIDDPVRQLIEYAANGGYTLTAAATTHPSRAYASVVGEENLVGVLRPGAVLPGGRSRLEATVSPARLQHIRSLEPEQADRQARALIRDLESQPIAPEHAVGIEAARIDARRFLDEHEEVPPAVLEQLHTDERALGDALSLDRTPASVEDLTVPAPDALHLRDRLLERAILVATLAAAYHDIESAVYAWTYARFLSSQDQDSKQAR
ncbi:hypothetical protein FK529_18200 [Tsukamurella asaccharolytica]|uniref:DUF5632 domain-containing protein n=1 Tax=Tsukamurella asaccharolytica TaxID=2592067 RepID=A0A5C5R6G0_9ACTN|nr:DUF5632 domain-containing protein [Tsukamurella asaccharolytica]TWS17913.1 hypothetical protein FK529_18200 [Tsukamurella asaccharolytica]